MHFPASRALSPVCWLAPRLLSQSSGGGVIMLRENEVANTIAKSSSQKRMNSR
jgi:hypothetical protein